MQTTDRGEPIAVFALLRRRVREGEIQDVRHMLPKELKALWAGATPGS